jgi:hypothetical protein
MISGQLNDALVSCDDVCLTSALHAMNECEVEMTSIDKHVWPSRPLDAVKYVCEKC